MARDDMEVILYKILRYVYECMKAGVLVDYASMQSSAQWLNIPQRYWEQVMKIAIDEGFIDGVSYFVAKDGVHISNSKSISLTLKGRDYMRDNSGMQQAAEFVGVAFEQVIAGVIQGLMH